jgi:hypothetical protein
VTAAFVPTVCSELEQLAIGGKTVASEHRNDDAITTAEQTGDPSLIAAAHTHMAWVLAHQGEVTARPHAELAWEYFSVHGDAAALVWQTAVTLAWLRATTGNGEGVNEVLEMGAAAWNRAGKPPFDAGKACAIDPKANPQVVRRDPSPTDLERVDLVRAAGCAVEPY